MLPLARTLAWASLALGLFGLSGLVAQRTPQPAAGSAILSRPVTIGASLTAGFGTWRPLATYLDPAIKVPHRPIARHDDIMFFRRPTIVGKREVDDCLAEKPSMVIAIDFLFWYGYGFIWGDDIPKQRLARLEVGLAQLERIGVPLVIGDFPDMRGAHPWMLHAIQIPSADTLGRLNARLREWANDKPHVLVLPLGAWVKRLRNDRWPVETPDGPGRLNLANAIQWDRLHPTRLGYIFMLREAIDAIAKHFALDRSAIDFDPIDVARRMDLLDDLLHP